MNLESLYPSGAIPMAKAKKRRFKKRKAVDRTERVAATPETLAKLRPCPLKAMLHIGITEPENPAGMYQQHYDACLEIWDAHDALVRQAKATASGFQERADKAHITESNRVDHLIAVYLKWATEIMRRYWLQSSTVVGWIDDSDPATRLINDTQRRLLVKACDCWIDMMDQANRARRVDRQRHTIMVTQYGRPLTLA